MSAVKSYLADSECLIREAINVAEIKDARERMGSLVSLVHKCSDTATRYADPVKVCGMFRADVLETYADERAVILGVW